MKLYNLMTLKGFYLTLTSFVLDVHKEFISDIDGVDIGSVYIVDSLESHFSDIFDTAHFYVVLR